MELETPPPPSSGPEATEPVARRWKPWLRTALNWKILLSVAVVAILLFILKGRQTDAHPSADNAAAITVAVAKVTREDLFNEIPIPAEFRPYAEVELHAKVSGYVDRINVDFGDKVKCGQLLATLEVPELRDQLHSALAMQQRDAADYTNAHLIYTRLQTVNQQHPNLMAQQDLDTAQAKDNSAAAALAAAKAEVERYETLMNYTRITAPFDGIITRRYADPGALIQAGTASETQSLPLVRVSDNYHLRLDFPVSVQYVKDIHVGDPVTIQVDSLGNKAFAGTITRATGKVTQDTRTMIVEVEMTNSNLQIVPGMYAAVNLKVQRHPQVLAIPSQVVGGEKNPTVYVVNDNSEIEARPITLGLETPNKYEVASGLKEGDLVMVGNRSLVHPGEKVEPLLMTNSVAP